jgi:hypothetical protein
VFEKRVLRIIFGPKRDEVTGELRTLHSEELYILYSSPNIFRQMKSRRMRWAGHVARMGEEYVQGFGGKARRIETTWETKAWMGRLDQNGSQGDWLGKCRLDPVGSG